MKDKDNIYVYDKSVSANSNTSVLSTIIGHLCVGPFRLIGRIFSNICLLPNIELLRLLKIAALFNMIILASYLVFYFRNLKIIFIVSSLTVTLTFIGLTLFLMKMDKDKNDEIIGGELDIDYDSVEQKCNGVPKELDKILKQSNLQYKH